MVVTLIIPTGMQIRDEMMRDLQPLYPWIADFAE
jgi:hypothetical protein